MRKLFALGSLLLALCSWLVPVYSQQPGAKSAEPKTAEELRAKSQEPVQVPNASEPDAVQDLVFFGDKRPVLLRFRVEVEGKPLKTAWRDFMAEYFKHLDRDSDGVLNKSEADAIQDPGTLFAGPLGVAGAGGVGGGNVSFRRLDTKKTDGKVTLEELSEYFAENGGGAFQPQPGPGVNPVTRALNETLFTRLDADKDDKLSPAELKSAADSLLKMDVNEDEMIAQAELGPNPYLPNAGDQVQFIAEQFEDRRARVEGEPYLVVEPGGDSRLRSQLQARYGKGEGTNRNRKLAAGDLGLDAAAFAALDRNKDAVLDGPELERFAERPADLAFLVRTGKPAESESAIEPIKAAGTAQTDLRRQASDLLVVDIDNARLELRRVETGGSPPRDQIEQFYKDRFKDADGDANAYLDNIEAQRNPIFRLVFKQMDKDGDGMVFEKEMLAYFKSIETLQTKAAACRVSVVVSEGQGMFELLDANRDTRLTIRELKDAPKLIEQLDRNGDGSIAKGEVPRSFQFAFSRGSPANPAMVRGRLPPPRDPAAAPPTLPAVGPVWFRKMDRNRDGDVSRREFLGAKADFDRLDKDGDNLISPEEAKLHGQ